MTGPGRRCRWRPVHRFCCLLMLLLHCRSCCCQSFCAWHFFIPICCLPSCWCCIGWITRRFLTKICCLHQGCYFRLLILHQTANTHVKISDNFWFTDNFRWLQDPSGDHQQSVSWLPCPGLWWCWCCCSMSCRLHQSLTVYCCSCYRCCCWAQHHFFSWRCCCWRCCSYAWFRRIPSLQPGISSQPASLVAWALSALLRTGTSCCCGWRYTAKQTCLHYPAHCLVYQLSCNTSRHTCAEHLMQYGGRGRGMLLAGVVVGQGWKYCCCLTCCIRPPSHHPR